MMSCKSKPILRTLLAAALVTLMAPGLARAQLAGGAASAAGGVEPRRITFGEAIELALEQSVALERAENQVELEDLSISQARMQFLPSLNASLSGDQSYGRYFSEDEGRLLNETNRSMSGRISTSVTLFDGFANTSRLDQAQLGRESALSELQRTRQSVVFSVISGFLDLIATTEQLEVLAGNLEAQLEQERQVQALVDGGRRPVSDLYQQQANVASARASLVDGRRAASLAEVELVQALRLDPGGEYDFVPPALPDTIGAAAAPDFNTLLQAAFERRPDLASLRLRVSAAGEGVDVARASRWPSLSLSAGYGSAYNTATDLPFEDQLDQRRGGSIGLGISFPIFDRRSTARATAEAEIQQENARLALADAEQQVGLEVRRALLDRGAAVERLAAAEARVVAAERALQSTEQRYQAGVATLLEVTQARAEQVSASSAAVNARYTLLFQEELLDYYAGELDTESLGG